MISEMSEYDPFAASSCTLPSAVVPASVSTSCVKACMIFSNTNRQGKGLYQPVDDEGDGVASFASDERLDSRSMNADVLRWIEPRGVLARASTYDSVRGQRTRGTIFNFRNHCNTLTCPWCVITSCKSVSHLMGRRVAPYAPVVPPAQLPER